MLIYHFNLQMHNKALVKHYTGYVNNFAFAMHTLERSIMKKQRFVQFLKKKYMSSKTSLSLQGLLLKPIQRFPQYILFLTVLLVLNWGGDVDYPAWWYLV